MYSKNDLRVETLTLIKKLVMEIEDCKAQEKAEMANKDSGFWIYWRGIVHAKENEIEHLMDLCDYRLEENELNVDTINEILATL